jgi:hypothetical protein
MTRDLLRPMKAPCPARALVRNDSTEAGLS